MGCGSTMASHLLPAGFNLPSLLTEGFDTVTLEDLVAPVGVKLAKHVVRRLIRL